MMRPLNSAVTETPESLQGLKGQEKLSSNTHLEEEAPKDLKTTNMSLKL